MSKMTQAGVALVLVLWMLMLLTIMAASYGYAMRTGTKLTIHHVELAKARAIAEAGLWLAVADLLKPKPQRQWLADGTPNRIDYGEGKINLGIQNESGKIDLNTAGDALLRVLLESTSLQDDEVTSLLHAILDWRDKDNLKRAAGAEDEDYERANAGYGAKDGSFNSVEELRLVAGMTNVVYRKIYPTLTVHSLQAGVNPRLAPREVLLALSDSHTEQIDEFLATRNSPDEPITIADVDMPYFTGTEGNTLTLTSEAEVGQSQLRLDMVIVLNGSASQPYSVLSWQESKTTYQPLESGDAHQASRFQ